MNKTTLLLIAIGAGILLAGKKLFGSETPKNTSLAGQARGFLDSVGNRALDAIPSRYSFKAPSSAVLGGNRSAANEVGSVDLAKLYRSLLDSLRSNRELKDGNGPHSTEEDYLSTVATQKLIDEQEAARSLLIANGFPEAPIDTIGPGGQILTDYGGFYGPAAPLDPLPGQPGRNFSLEDSPPLNSTEGPQEINNPFLYDAPGGADFSLFTEPQSLSV